jgi:hypothetical protein
VSAIGHYLEGHGIATTGISLVREHTDAMQVPRFLWVPFPLGRPFGAPNAPDFQRRVLLESLRLLEATDGPVVLRDFPDDAPSLVADDNTDGWSCAVSFAGRKDHGGDTVAAEIESLRPWNEVVALARPGAPSNSTRLSIDELATRLTTLCDPSTDLDDWPAKELMATVRLTCSDVRTWYQDAAVGQPGPTPTPGELENWFWRETAVARRIAELAERLWSHSDAGIARLAMKAMVPRDHIEYLLPGREPSI